MPPYGGYHTIFLKYCKEQEDDGCNWGNSDRHAFAQDAATLPGGSKGKPSRCGNQLRLRYSERKKMGPAADPFYPSWNNH